jgi:hypothetical protein
MRAFTLTLAAVLGTVLTGAAPATGGAEPDARCQHASTVVVPGAEHVESACLDDLTTASTVQTGHTVPADYAGLAASATRNPSGVPGLQLDGYFPDDSHTNTNHGWNHDAQFVIRLPQHWNGGLVVTGTPGNRRQYALDSTISDWVLAQGYAFAATDKGNTGTSFYTDSPHPGDAVAEWNDRVTQLTVAAKAAVASRYHRAPKRTIAAGLSNGGYLVRWQLENHPELYDGGVDWEGTLWLPDGPNLFTYLPTTLREYPRYAATGDPSAHEKMLAAGFAPGSEFLWPFHDRVYWGLTQRIYRQVFDPGYTCAEADYDYASRPDAVHDAVARVSLTGDIRKPLLTLHGTLDTLLPITTDSDVYARMVGEQDGAEMFRYYRIVDGNHTDGLYDQFPDRLRPILPCFRSAFSALASWVERGTPPPPSTTVPRPATGDVVNTCSLTS